MMRLRVFAAGLVGRFDFGGQTMVLGDRRPVFRISFPQPRQRDRTFLTFRDRMSRRLSHFVQLAAGRGP